MDKVRIKLVTIGHMPPRLNIASLSQRPSEIFELGDNIDSFALRCDSDIDDWGFSDKLLKTQIPQNADADFLIAIVNVPIEDNWYSRRLGDNKIVLTLHQIRDFLELENIPLENVILRILYSYTLLYRRSENKIPDFGLAYSFTHDETRGCLFDMNGIKTDLIESCNKPIICAECEERMMNERISTQMIKSAQKEIRKIRKHLYYRVFDFVKVKPLTTLAISSAFAILLGITGSVTASYVYDSIKQQASPPLQVQLNEISKTHTTK